MELQDYNHDPCEMCGGIYNVVKFQEAQTFHGGGYVSYKPEHLLKTCTNCGYRYKMKCLNTIMEEEIK